MDGKCQLQNSLKCKKNQDAGEMETAIAVTVGKR